MRAAHGVEQILQVRAREEIERRLAVTHHPFSDEVFERGVDAPSGQITQARIAIVVDVGPGGPQARADFWPAQAASSSMAELTPISCGDAPPVRSPDGGVSPASHPRRHPPGP